MKYYVYERFIDPYVSGSNPGNPNAFSGKYLRFEEFANTPINTNTLGYAPTNKKPDFFLLPNRPYATEENNVFKNWVYNKDTQNLFTVTSGNSVLVRENSVYTFANPIQTLSLTIDGNFLKESSVFFTFSGTGTHSVTFSPASKVIGSVTYWESNKSYIITVYNGYYIIGHSRAV